jgi:hypothetical protein
MAITAFPALAPRLRLVTYPDNLKPNIKKYDKCSDPYIWLLTYYVAVKAAGGNFDHMAAYFPLVMGDAPSLCINNIPAGSITSWADLQSTWKCLQPREGDHEDQRAASRLHHRFFENCNTCVGVWDNQVFDSYKKGIKDRKIFEKIHESGATIVATLMEVVNKLIYANEALVNQFDSDAKRDARTSSVATNPRSKLRKRTSEVLAMEGRRPSTSMSMSSMQC